MIPDISAAVVVAVVASLIAPVGMLANVSKLVSQEWALKTHAKRGVLCKFCLYPNLNVPELHYKTCIEQTDKNNIVTESKVTLNAYR